MRIPYNVIKPPQEKKYKIDTTLKNEIDCLIIKIGNIDELSYQDEYYTKKLIKLDL